MGPVDQWPQICITLMSLPHHREKIRIQICTTEKRIRKTLKTILAPRVAYHAEPYLNQVYRIRIGFNANPDPGRQINADLYGLNLTQARITL
jgi:hypothetical protein